MGARALLITSQAVLRGASRPALWAPVGSGATSAGHGHTFLAARRHMYWSVCLYERRMKPSSLLCSCGGRTAHVVREKEREWGAAPPVAEETRRAHPQLFRLVLLGLLGHARRLERLLRAAPGAVGQHGARIQRLLGQLRRQPTQVVHRDCTCSRAALRRVRGDAAGERSRRRWCWNCPSALETRHCAAGAAGPLRQAARRKFGGAAALAAHVCQRQQVTATCLTCWPWLDAWCSSAVTRAV